MKIIITLLIGIILYMNIKFEKKILTPMVCLIGPYLLLLSLSILSFNSQYISDNFFLNTLLFTLIFFITSSLYINIFQKYLYIKNNEKNLKIIKKIALLSIIALIYVQIKTGLSNGFDNIKGNQRGLFAHIYIICSPFCMVYFLEILKKINIKKNIALLLISVVFIMLGAKYQVLIFILPLSLYYYDSYSKSIKILLLIFVMTYIVFYISYLTKFYFRGINVKIIDYTKFVTNHYLMYLLSPFMVGSEYLKETTNPDGITATFSWLINIFEVFKNNQYVSPVLKFIKINEMTSNVGSLFGELVYNLGIKISVIYVFILSIICYWVEFISVRNRNWIYLQYLLKSCLILCFFNNVFSVLGYIERLIGVFLICFILNILPKKNKEKGEI